MRFLLRVDSHARNHSAYPQAQSQVAALRACAAARSARVLQRRAPRVSLGATCGRRRALHQPCARELGRAQLGRPLSPQRQVTCTEGRHWSFAAAGCGHVAEEGRDTASARRVLRRQASFEAAVSFGFSGCVFFPHIFAEITSFVFENVESLGW